MKSPVDDGLMMKNNPMIGKMATMSQQSNTDVDTIPLHKMFHNLHKEAKRKNVMKKENRGEDGEIFITSRDIDEGEFNRAIRHQFEIKTMSKQSHVNKKEA